MIKKTQHKKSLTQTQDELKFDNFETIVSNTYNRNHAIAFEKYSPRKSMFGRSSFPVISYAEPNKYPTNPKGINFSKMPKRDIKFGNLFNHPSIGYYKPNLDVIRERNYRTIKFSSDNLTNKKHSSHKLWSSYDVGSEYKSVNLKFIE
jgi:hypothetical protein